MQKSIGVETAPLVIFEESFLPIKYCSLQVELLPEVITGLIGQDDRLVRRSLSGLFWPDLASWFSFYIY